MDFGYLKNIRRTGNIGWLSLNYCHCQWYVFFSWLVCTSNSDCRKDLAPLDQVAIWRGGFTAFDTIASMIGGPAGSGIAKALGWRW